jgi:hypothetical protein
VVVCLHFSGTHLAASAVPASQLRGGRTLPFSRNAANLWTDRIAAKFQMMQYVPSSRGAGTASSTLKLGASNAADQAEFAASVGGRESHTVTRVPGW